MKEKRYLIIIKSLLLAAASFAFLACSNLFGDSSPESSSSDKAQTITITGNISISEDLKESGALPAEYLFLFNQINDLNERSAFPSTSSTNYYATATAEGKDDVNGTITTTATGASFTMAIPIDDTATTWTIEAGLKDSFNSSTVTILKDSWAASFSNTNPSFSHDFIIKPLTSGSGDIDLTISSTTSTANTPDTLELYLNGTKVTAGTGETITPSKITLKNRATGTYKARLVFKQNGYVVFTDYQGITVFPNMTTNTWVNSKFSTSVPINGSTYTLTDTLVQDYRFTQIYVGSVTIGTTTISGNDTSGNGTIFAPFATFAKAISFLQENGNSFKDYTIWICGEISGAQTISDGTTESPTPILAKSLTISGYSGNTTDKLKGGSSGSVLLVDTSVSITITNLLITGGTGTNTAITSNLTKPSGGGLNIKKGTVTLDTGAQITGNHADYGGGVYVASGATLIMKGNSLVGDAITNSTTTATATSDCANYASYGGGIFSNGGSLYIGYLNTTTVDSDFSGGVNRNFCPNGGNTTTAWGAGIYYKGLTFKMSGGNVSYNYAYSDGGGLVISGENTNFYFTGGSVAKNHARLEAGGIYLKDKANIFMSGSAIIGDTGTSMTQTTDFSNRVTSDSGNGGGGIRIEGSAKLYLGYTDASHIADIFTGGICHNYSPKNGGGINNYYGQVYIAKGNISYNKSEAYGGGVQLSSTLNMTGGTFTGNICGTGNGGAINFSGGNFNFNGGVSFTSGSAKNNDIYISGNLKITFAGTATTGSAVITPSEWTRGKQIFAAGSGVTITDDMLAQFSLTDSAWKIVLHSSVGKLDADIYVSGTSANDTNGDGTASNPYGTLATAISKCWDSNKNYTIYVKDTLTGNQEISGTITAKSITLQGTGINPSIDANQNGRPLLINTSKEVTIKGLAIKNGKLTSGDGGGISVSGGCTLTLDSGAEILSNDNYTSNNTGKGGGIYIASGNTVIMKSGSVVNLNRAKEGGGIYNEGKLLMNGTSRIGSTVTAYPTNPWAPTPQTPTGNCSHAEGGGVYNKGTLCLGYSSWTSGSTNQTENLTGGVTGNFSEGQGGGVYLNTSSNLYFNTGNISYNRSSDRGGGVYIYNSSMTMSGGTMTSNCHDGGLSGAIHVNGNLYLSGDIYIPYGFADNSWYQNGAKNNIYLDSDKFITLNGTLSHSGTVAVLSTAADYSSFPTVLKVGEGVNGSNLGDSIGKINLEGNTIYGIAYFHANTNNSYYGKVQMLYSKASYSTVTALDVDLWEYIDNDMTGGYVYDEFGLYKASQSCSFVLIHTNVYDDGEEEYLDHYYVMDISKPDQGEMVITYKELYDDDDESNEYVINLSGEGSSKYINLSSGVEVTSGNAVRSDSVCASINDDSYGLIEPYGGMKVIIIP